MDLAPQILEMLATGGGLKASHIAKQLDVDRKLVNAALYGSLKGQVLQDKSYCWHLASAVKSSSKTPTTSAVTSVTVLSKICRYYLECLSFDNEQGVSTFADGQYDVDYAELQKLPLDEDSSTSVFTAPEVNKLIERMKRERFKKTLYLGYPTSIHSFTARSGARYKMVEPVMIFPMEVESAEGNATPKFQLQYPQFNSKAMGNLLQSRGPQLLQEIIALGEQLGLNSDPDDLPEFDELFLRLHDLSDSWNWVEAPDPENLNTAPSLRSAETGIYNRAVLIMGERSGYTAGLETELATLQNKTESEFRDTALGDWVLNTSPASEHSAEKETPLLEVLPLNTEQRQAVRSALHQKLTVVTGPPGTGKSQVVTALLVNAAWRGKRVLFASKNHKAVDVVEHRVNGLGPRPILLRLGGNELQERLADYLSKVLGMSPTSEDREDYVQLRDDYRSILKKRQALDKKTEEIIAARNKVDHLDQSIAKAREVFGDACFSNLKDLQVNASLGALQRFRLSVKHAHCEEQGFLVTLFWGLCRKKRFVDAEASLKETLPLIGTLGLSSLDDNVDDSNIGLFMTLGEELSQRYDLAIEVKEYFTALEMLSSSDKLEEIDSQLLKLDDQMASVAMRLWQKWLMLMPTRLSAADRELLASYATIIQLMAEASKAGQMVAKAVYAKYRMLFPKVMNILSCWAVTSLSAKGRVPLEAGFFDLVVIDEASQCDIASALPLLYRAKQVVIIGDPNQLKHISPIPRAKDVQLLDRHDLLDAHTKYAYSVNSLYDLAASMVAPGSLVNLRDHHRSHADIIGFSNTHFYENTLRVATRYDNLNLLSKDEPSVRWIHVDGQATRPRGGSALNVPEAEKVVATIEDLLLNRGYTGSIGVVSPFRAQVNSIERLLRNSSVLSSSAAAADILVDTVHKFQGDERDLMIFSPVVAEGIQKSSIGFLRGNGNLFNVAITRARSALIVVGDINAARSSEIDYLSAFAVYAQALLDQRENKIESAQDIELTSNYPAVLNPEQVSDWERWFYGKLFAAGLRPIPQYAEEKYRLDFALFDGDRKLDLEVDGERYHRDWNGELCRRDRIRNQRLMELGWDVMRFWVYEIRDDTEACIERVREWLKK
jgi:very-short-patch-repair endonuclease